MNITDSVINKLLRDKKVAKIQDPAIQGFYVRCNTRGIVSFIMRYSSPVTKQDIVVPFGIYPTMSLLEAKRLAFDYRIKLSEGIDIRKVVPKTAAPIAQWTRTKKYELNHKNVTGTVNHYVHQYLIYSTRMCKTSTMKLKTLALHRLVDHFDGRILTSIKRSEIGKLLDEVDAKHGPSSALAVIRNGSAMWTFFMQESDVIEMNPLQGLKARCKLYKSGVRKDYLKDEQLQTFINDDYSRLPESCQRAALICLYTGCRVGMATKPHYAVKLPTSPVLGMCWSEIDWNKRTWYLAADRMKGSREETVPLSNQLYGLLYEWWQADGSPKFGAVSHTGVGNGRNISATSFGNHLRSRNLGFRAHDLRRTVSTHLQELGCPLEVRLDIRYHVQDALAQHYDQGSLMKPKTEWLQTWADKLDTLGFARLLPQAKAERLGLKVVN